MGLLQDFKKANPGQKMDLTEIIGEVFRVTTFDFEDTKWDGSYKPKSPDGSRSYGYLIVESANQEKRVVPITHEQDFAMIARIYLNEQVLHKLKKYEILITYFPKPDYTGDIKKAPHNLHLAAVPKKTLEQYYILAGMNKKPSLEKIFGPFVWEGEIEMQFNFGASLKD